MDEILAQYQEQLSGLGDEEYQRMRLSIVKAEISQRINKFIADYEIAAESISGMGIFIPKFTAELDTALIAQIIKDERVDLVLEEPPVCPGMNQAQ